MTTHKPEDDDEHGHDAAARRPPSPTPPGAQQGTQPGVANPGQPPQPPEPNPNPGEPDSNRDDVDRAKAEREAREHGAQPPPEGDHSHASQDPNRAPQGGKPDDHGKGDDPRYAKRDEGDDHRR